MKGLSNGTPGGITIRPSLARQGPSQDEALKQIQKLSDTGKAITCNRQGWWLVVSPGENGATVDQRGFTVSFMVTME
jgi:hypothetical protein